MRRILLILGTLIAIFGALYYWRYETLWQLKFMLDPGGDFDVAEAGLTPDYADPAAWFHKDDLAGADAAVFYIHPSTLLKTTTWNQPLTGEQEDEFLVSVAGKQVEIFAPLPVRAPYYRQAAFHAFIETSGDSAAARDLASADVLAAFRSFAAAYPDDPIIVAGHSQGAYHAAALVNALAAEPDLLARIAVVYAIGYPFPQDYLATISALHACDETQKIHCILSYNARGRGAYIPGFFAKAPLPDGAARGGGTLACWNPARASSVVAAACDDEGWLLIDRPPEEYRDFLMSREWYHTVELKLFAEEIRRDAEARIAILKQ